MITTTKVTMGAGAVELLQGPVKAGVGIIIPIAVLFHKCEKNLIIGS